MPAPAGMGGLSPGWNTGPHTPPLCWPPSPCLMSHELPVCLLLPAVSALPLPGQSLKHMLLRSTEQPDKQAQPNCYKEQSCHFLLLPFSPLLFSPWVFIQERDGMFCNKTAIADAMPDLANMAAPRNQCLFEAPDKHINGSIIGLICYVRHWLVWKWRWTLFGKWSYIMTTHGGC